MYYRFVAYVTKDTTTGGFIEGYETDLLYFFDKTYRDPNYDEVKTRLSFGVS